LGRLLKPARRNKEREIFENVLGKKIFKEQAKELSHGIKMSGLR
jgi:hypothetical protein